MSQKKVVGRNVAILLGVICIVLIAGLGGAIAYYNGYVANHHYADDDYNAQVSKPNTYLANHHHTDDEYNALTKPQLTTVGLDTRNSNGEWPYAWSYLTITSYVFNMGTETAYSCRFRVHVWSSDGTLLLETLVNLGNIAGRSYIYQATETPYNGTGDHWSVVPEFTDTP